MQQDLENLLQAASQAIATAVNLDAVEQLRVRYLGKKGELTDLLKGVSQLPKEQRKEAGMAVNQAKQHMLELLKQKHEQCQKAHLAEKLAREVIDVTLPGRGQNLGSLHPVTKVMNRAVELFSSLGFSVEEGPEIEDEYHNFSALNMPKHHPARASQDTFYLEGERLLRTHTSSVQIHVMQQQAPPLRIITPGRVYRCDSDQTHTPMFHQLEGLVIDEHSTFADLKGLLHDFISQFFEADMELRFRPSYFPFTEPSAEVDIRWKTAAGEQNDQWLEVLGCGMVHPNVLRNVDIDPDRYSGFAFGLGLDRLAMLRYGINDLRLMFDNDLRFLEQFK